MASELGEVRISVEVGGQAGKRELVTAARALGQELSPVGRVKPVDSAAPSGTKGFGGLDPGSLLLAGALTPSLLRSLVRVVTAFIDRRSAQKIILEIDGDKVAIDGVSKDTERALVDAWIKRQASAYDSTKRESVAGPIDTRDEV
jgi:hypothetical protein